jgi:hypothetical protein
MTLSITKLYHYGECHHGDCRILCCYAESHYAVCYSAVCHYTECHYTECRSAVCCYADCCSAVCGYAECRVARVACSTVKTLSTMIKHLLARMRAMLSGHELASGPLAMVPSDGWICTIHLRISRRAIAAGLLQKLKIVAEGSSLIRKVIWSLGGHE